MSNHYILSLLSLCLPLTFAPTLHAEDTEHSHPSISAWQITPHLGYTIGGMTPVPLPAEIREIQRFHPTDGLSWGFDFSRKVSSQWRAAVGIHYFDRGMRTEARVKAYQVKVVQAGNTLEGYFSGVNHTRASQQGFALPLQAEWQPLARCTFFTGPVVEWYFDRSFTGSVTDGYLRVNQPTGRKVEFGASPEEAPTYDFSNDMARWGFGWQVGADWQVSSRWSVFLQARYIFTNLFQPGFTTVSMKLHPMFVTTGLAYRVHW